MKKFGKFCVFWIFRLKFEKIAAGLKFDIPNYSEN